MNFLARSAKRFQQQAIEILRADPTPSAGAPYALFQFPGDTDKWITGTDVDYKPSSTSTATLTIERDGDTEFTRFSGKTNADGYAAARSLVGKSSFYGTPTFDVSPYKYLAMRVRSSDSRRYFINLQSDSYMSTDLYQHRLFLQRPGEWEDVMLPWTDFTLTNNGQIQETQVEMDKYRLKTVGISVLDRLPGPFSLDVHYINAQNS